MAAEERFRAADLPPYLLSPIAAAINAARAAGRDVIDFSQINPDIAPPQTAVDKLVAAALLPHNHRYSSSPGIGRLREAMARLYAERFGVELDPETEVVATMGSKEGIAHLLLAVLRYGERVVVPTPTYPIHPAAVCIAGGAVVPFPLFSSWEAAEEGEFVLSDRSEEFFQRFDAIAAQGIRAVIVNFPHNPTTTVVTPGFFERLLNHARRHGALVIHDFAYGDICFGSYRAPSVLQVPEARQTAVEFYSLSKSFSTPGWRVGFCVGAAEVCAALKKVKSYLDFGIFQPIQIAAAHMLSKHSVILEETRAVYQARRDTLLVGLRELGWKVVEPLATVFLWAKVPARFAAEGSMKLSQRLLEEADVAVCPGTGFDPAAEGFMRFALVENEHRIRQGLRKMERVMAKVVLFAITCSLCSGLSLAAEECPKAAREREGALKLPAASREQEEALRQLLKLCPSMADAHYDLGVNLLKQNRLDDALASFRSATSLEPAPLFLLGTANTLALKGQLEDAEALYHKVRELEPREARAVMGLAHVYLQRGQLTEAEEALRQAIQLEPSDAKLYYDLGIVLERLNRLEEAGISFQTACDKSPNAIEGCLKLAENALRSHRLDVAERAINRTMLVAPKNVGVLLLSAGLREQKGDIRRALEFAQKAQEVEPDNPDVLRSLGTLLYVSGKQEDGLRVLRDAAQRFGGQSAIHAALGWALVQEKEYEEAQRELSYALQLTPDDAAAHNNLGVLLELRGEKEAARKHFERARELNPRLKKAEDNLQRIADEP